MKAEILLQIDDKGNPYLVIKHHDKDGSIDEKLLGIFLAKALTNGLEIKQAGWYDARSQGVLFNRYSITTP